MALFKRHRVYSLTELAARCEALLENYCKTVQIEARTMLSMARRELLPAISGFTAKLVATALSKRSLSPALPCAYETSRVTRLSVLTDAIDAEAAALERISSQTAAIPSSAVQAAAVRDELLPAMRRLRAACDEAESLTAADAWPFPTYAELLFSV